LSGMTQSPFTGSDPLMVTRGLRLSSAAKWPSPSQSALHILADSWAWGAAGDLLESAGRVVVLTGKDRDATCPRPRSLAVHLCMGKPGRGLPFSRAPPSPDIPIVDLKRVSPN
jgi:hypothetical protein